MRKNLMKSSEISFGFHLMKEKKLKYNINKDETAGEFLKRISEKNKRYRELLFDLQGELKKNIMIIINNHMVPYEKRFSTSLKGGDYLEIFFLVKGG